MKKGGWLSWLAWLLVVIGSINWGLVGLGGFLGGDWNLVSLILGDWPSVESLVYVLVGVAGVMFIFGCHCKKCNVGGMKKDMGMGGQQM